MNESGNGHFRRDPTGAWRYTLSGALVPGARDLYASDAYATLPRRTWQGRPVVELPFALLGDPAFTWAEDAACQAIDDPRAPGGAPLAVYVTETAWEHYAPRAWVCLWAPELLPELLLSSRQAAQRIGQTLGSWQVAVCRGRAPAPVGWLGTAPYWTAGVLDQWAAMPNRRQMLRALVA